MRESRVDNAKTPPRELVNHYLKDTPLLALFQARLPWVVNPVTRFSGQWIIAPQGRGKTNLLLNQIKGDLEKPGTIILMDSKGDTIDAIRDLKLPKEVVVIDPIEYLAINPLQIDGHSIDLLFYVFSGLSDTAMTPRQATFFRAILDACIKVIPDASMATVYDIVQNGMGKYQPYIQNLDPFDREFFEREIQAKNETFRQIKDQLGWRMHAILSNPLFRTMFFSPTTKIRMSNLMDSNKVVIINNSVATLGNASVFFSRFFIALVLGAAQQRAGRAENDKLPVYFYIDECDEIVKNDENIATIIDKCRSQKIALILAHQRMRQITSANVLDALTNCAIRMANSDAEAALLAPRLRINAQQLEALPVGSFAAFVRDSTKQGVILKLPKANLDKYPKLTRDELAFRSSLMKQLYCYEPEQEPEPRHTPPKSSPQTSGEPNEDPGVPKSQPW